MPRNYFSGVDTMGALRDGAGFVDDTVDRFRTARAGYRAAPKIAQGDYGGAAQEYGAMGMAGEAAKMRGEVEGQEQKQYERGRQTKADEQAAIARRVEQVKQLAGYVGKIRATPGEDPNVFLQRRHAFLQKSLPLLQEMTGMDVSQFGKLRAEDLTDDQLRAFGAEMDRQLQIINRGGGGYDVVDTETGAKVRGVEPTLKAPQGFRFTADGELEAIPGYAQGKGQIAAASRAPPRPRASGGGGGAPSGLPAGFVLD